MKTFLSRNFCQKSLRAERERKKFMGFFAISAVFRQINFILFNLVKTLLSRNFCVFLTWRFILTVSSQIHITAVLGLSLNAVSYVFKNWLWHVLWYIFYPLEVQLGFCGLKKKKAVVEAAAEAVVVVVLQAKGRRMRLTFTFTLTSRFRLLFTAWWFFV